MREVSVTAQTLTLGSHFRRSTARTDVHVSVHTDHAAPGSHLIWTIENESDRAIALTSLVVRGARTTSTVQLERPQILMPGERVVLPTDVDWNLLDARQIAAVDADGREHAAPRQQLEAARGLLRDTIDRPALPASAREFLNGAADMAVGIAILGLGFFMLLWVLATE
jgi:hypothetical protein